MRGIKMICTIVFSMFLTATAWAQTGSAQQQQIQNTIQSQIDAFAADDVGTAFGFAAPSIQSLFGGPQRFGAMVQNGYPMVWRNRSVEFGGLQDIAGRLWQRVYLTDLSGVEHALDYVMVQIDGEWRIAGVMQVPQPQLGV